MIRICPSILNANFDELPSEIAKVAQVSDLLHLDVMDNKFVPNFTFSFERAREIIEGSQLPVDVHLMIANADKEALPYLDTSALSITVHFEACADPLSLLTEIRRRGKRSAIAIKPGTAIDEIRELIPAVDMILVMTVEPGFGGQKFMSEMMPKVEVARRWLDEGGFGDTWLQVDGGVNLETISKAKQAGADTFVAGSVVFNSPDPAGVVETLRQLAAAAK
ncbi:MAG: ribulose-phosphate 3-epimerase [Candidatus Nanopelagicaceae bacterium]|nr:ribulose-phosphate 3-epimerase [Actinomycetota bacterium]NDA40017.1 ribulose-phosphate 3-epimerase [Actinomycetota bacterium]NDE47564.1 ribulose-phosphate 3-epimerase [Actinomycetota bacterium]